MGGSPRRREQVRLGPVVDAIRECRRLGIETVYITGGEPLLYPGLDHVLEAAAGVEGLETVLCTNGTLLTSDHAERFRKMGIRLHISVDGPPEFHDRFRRLQGAFRFAERGVQRAVEAGISVSIVSSISRYNLDSLEFLVNWAAETGACQFFVQPLLITGRGDQIADACLSFAQMDRMILQLTDLANRPRKKRIECQVVGENTKLLREHPCRAYLCNGSGCHRGVSNEIKKLVIREDGCVLPEAPTLSKRYALGNVNEGSLSELVERYFANGYSDFQALCRRTYTEVLPNWDCIVMPWDQILAERSQGWSPGEVPSSPAHRYAHDEMAYGAWRGISPELEPAEENELCQIETGVGQ